MSGSGLKVTVAVIGITDFAQEELGIDFGC